MTRGSQYTYRVRHVQSGIAGGKSDSFTVVANPVPPETLICSGTTDTTITCQWADKEPDTVMVYRRVGTNDSTHIADVPPSTGTFTDTELNKKLTYCYRVRYRRGATDFSGFSNQWCAQPGDQQPLRPGR